MATEKRLIDANALKSKAWPEEVTGEGIVYVEDIDNFPTVDAVEVVRCNACQSHEPCAVKGRVWCKKLCRYMKEDGFCSEGVNVND